MSETVVVITGASAGIGAATAELLAREGCRVVLVARRQAALEEVAGRCAGQPVVIAADLTKRDAVRVVVERAIHACGHIDVWINNAGQGITRAPSELTDDDVDEMMKQNVKTALYGMQEVLPHFKERGAGQIVNVSSMLGRLPMATFRSAYTASKHYLNALTAMIRDEVTATHPGIQISLVSPGVVRTDFGLSALHGGPDSRALPGSQSAEEIAEVIASVIRSRKADLYTRRGARERVAAYYATLGEDPE